MYLKYIINSNLFHNLPDLESKTLGCWCNPPKKFTKCEFFCYGCVLIQLYKIVKYHHFDTHMVQNILKKIIN